MCLMWEYALVKPKQIYSSSTTMHGIPQNSHLGAAVRWEERKLRKSCNRSGGWRVTVCSNAEPLKSSGRVNKTILIVQTHARVSGSWHANGRPDRNAFALCIRTAGCWDGRVGNGGQRDQRGCGLHPDRLHPPPQCQKLAGAERCVIFHRG